jgi:hypothetical protein
MGTSNERSVLLSVMVSVSGVGSTSFDGLMA